MFSYNRYAVQFGFDKATWKSSTGNKNSVTNNQIWKNGKNRRLLLLAAAIEKLNRIIKYILDPKHCTILFCLYLIKSIPLSFISGLTLLFQVAQNTDFIGKGVLKAEHFKVLYHIIPSGRTVTAMYNLMKGINL